MPFLLDPFADVGESGLSEPLLSALIDRHERHTLPRLRRLWTYYRNPATAAPDASRRPRLGQEVGLPDRLAGRRTADGRPVDDRLRAGVEIVIENDISWRIHTMVEFMLGRPVRLVSGAKDAAKRRAIELALDRIWEASGGIALLQDAALLGHVYGHVDLMVRAGEAWGVAGPDSPELAVRIEVIDPTRGIPLLNPRDARRLDAYVVRYQRESGRIDPGPGLLQGFRRLLGAAARTPSRDDGPSPRSSRRGAVTATEIYSPGAFQRYEDTGSGPRLLDESPNLVSPGEVPIVHIQNLSQPLAYEGLGEVEPLIPLQDELNTRLSDRASRVTLQSFKMYLCKGLEGLDHAGIGPGTVWTTDNPEASVQAFGGDAASPSEDRHIAEIREALDKASGVPPLATGVVQAKVGNLTSENALRITLAGLLSRTARKRIAYGRGIAEASRLALGALDRAGVLKTDPADRVVRVEWPDPLPPDEEQRLRDAKARLDVGVPRETVLAELGYSPTRDEGVV